MPTGDDNLRALIRLIPPARALKEDLEKQLHLEMYAGTGDMAVRSFTGLRDSVARFADDPYVEALSVDVPADATDKEKVSLVLLSAGQLAAYLEGQTGLAGMGGGGGGHFQYSMNSPNINGVNIKGLDAKSLSRVFGGKGDHEEEPKADEDSSEE